MPSEEGEILGKLYNNSVGTFISEENGWYQINSGSVTGYVKGEFCVTGEEAVALLFLLRQTSFLLFSGLCLHEFTVKRPATLCAIPAM